MPREHQNVPRTPWNRPRGPRSDCSRRTALCCNAPKRFLQPQATYRHPREAPATPVNPPEYPEPLNPKPEPQTAQLKAPGSPLERPRTPTLPQTPRETAEGTPDPL
ncbi:hypothetical protein PGTUg99_025951 [Puccinia graminis f. sp. tritici]|uniref:Uncharacterized protein n=1 Tax=Puccinia graminis f. sp. tritici TaxID=56615 RepID=A0A5B0PNU3_PUCGR|nr:hypothetical protein PGTUg99_025951 [Puccinia graminis f. sp. tritici]